jgi:Nucleotidyl transferase
MGGLTSGSHGTTGRPVLVMMAAGVARRYGGCKPLAPVGLHGEAVIDLNAGDAMRAGFGDIALVLGPATGPAITYHVRRTWPKSVAVSFALQAVPLGTVHAVVSARRVVGDRPFAVINADDIYGVPALTMLADHLATTDDHALVSYALRDTVVTADPVTRGMCETTGDGWLRALVERRMVSRHDDGTFTADDGVEPKEIPGDTPVSMNLWGFSPSVWPVLEKALRAVHPDLGPDGSVGDTGPASDVEVLLPEVVGDMAGGAGDESAPGSRVRVLPGTGRCVGVTHADDLPVVRMELAEMVGQGLRAEGPWGAGT